MKNRIIKGYLELQVCYKDFLKTAPAVTNGNLKMDWQIDTDGDVLSPEVVTSPFQSESFHKCMADKIKTWKFPEPVVKKYVIHTFGFEKKDFVFAPYICTKTKTFEKNISLITFPGILI